MIAVKLPTPLGATVSEQGGVMLVSVPGWVTLYDVTLHLPGGPRRFLYRASLRELFAWKRGWDEKIEYIRIEVAKVNECPEAEGWLRECWGSGG